MRVHLRVSTRDCPRNPNPVLSSASTVKIFNQYYPSIRGGRLRRALRFLSVVTREAFGIPHLELSPERHTPSSCLSTKEPDSGARPHPAWPAAEEGSRRDTARLQTTRHDDVICRAQRARRHGDRPATRSA